MSGESVHLFRLETGVAEHADLPLNVRPVSRGVVLVLQEVVQGFPHGDDSVGHALDFELPVLVQLGGVEDLSGKTSAAGGNCQPRPLTSTTDLTGREGSSTSVGSES